VAGGRDVAAAGQIAQQVAQRRPVFGAELEVAADFALADAAAGVADEAADVFA
jgi:hypothetical protein